MKTVISAWSARLKLGKRASRSFLGVCFLLASLIVGTVQAESYETFAFSNILEKPTDATEKGYFQNVEVNYADPAGGELVVSLGNPSNSCLEQYLVTWTFNEDIQAISPNDVFSADYTITSEGGNCKGIHAPVVEIVGSGPTKLVADYAQKCEADLNIRGKGSQATRQARVNKPGHIEFIADGAVRTSNNRPSACGYAFVTLKVKSKGTEYELVYIYMSQQ